MLDAEMPAIVKKNWDAVRRELRLPAEELSNAKLNKFKDLLGKHNTTRMTQRTTLRRDEATASMRNSPSDDCLSRCCNTFDPRPCGDCDASTLRTVSGEDPDKTALAWFPTNSDEKSVTSVHSHKTNVLCLETKI